MKTKKSPALLIITIIGTMIVGGFIGELLKNYIGLFGYNHPIHFFHSPGNEWNIIDRIVSLPKMTKFQIWHHDDYKITIKGILPSSEEIVPLLKPSFNSKYYGVLEEGKSTVFSFDSEISTNIKLEN